MLYDFRIEYRENPIGIDNPPRFSWKIKSSHPDLVQTAYQIQVTGGGKLMWDSGCVCKEQPVCSGSLRRKASGAHECISSPGQCSG